MRNLKKILALVLALVMSLSLMATAGAADAAATSSETVTPAYEIALQVLGKDGLKVFGGYTDGTIRPQNNITRAEVAAILYRIVTGDVTDAQAGIYTDMANVNFNDLTGANWAKGYINYCANAQLIVGVGGNQFKPLANITGYATLAMILRALGYDKNGEFKGSGWEIRTASKARELGILKNVSENQLGSPATRELVAELLFRAMLCDKVTYNALTQDYDKTGVTLGYSVFSLEEVEGVVVANEYADLRRDADGKGTDKTAADDTTVLRDAAGKDRTVTVASGLEDLGETRVAYTIENGKRNQYDLKNVKLENPGKDTITYDGGEEFTKAQVNAKIVGNEAEHYINFGEDFTKATTTIKVTYQAKKIVDTISALNTERAVNAFLSKYHLDGTNNVVRTGYTEAMTLRAYLTANTKFDSYMGSGAYIITYEPEVGDIAAAGYVEGDHTFTVDKIGTETYYRVQIKPGAAFTSFDVAMVTDIFNFADLWNISATTTRIIDGEVYRGTQSVYDYSDWRSYESFREDCIKESVEDTNVGANGKGWWLKIIDNDNDGVTDWVFQTRYTVASVASVKDGVPTLDVTTTCGDDGVNAKSKITDGTINEGDEVVANDVVLYAVLDGKARVWKAEYVDARVNSINRSNLTVTVDGDTTYEESANHEHSARTDIQSGVVNMSGTTSSRLYLDKYGYMAAFSQNINGKFVLLTNGWFQNLKNGVEYAVTAWDSESQSLKQYDVTSGGNLFVDGGVYDGAHSWNRILRFPNVNCDFAADVHYSKDDPRYVENDDLHTIVAYMETDGDNATLVPVDTIYDVEDQNDRGYYMIDMGKTIPTSALDTTHGKLQETTALARQPYNRTGAVAPVRALSDTIYYYVYHSYNTNGDAVYVHQITGYENGARWLNADAAEHIEDVYVVGRQSIERTVDGAVDRTFYTANVVVVELDDDFFHTHYDVEEVFVYDFPVVGTWGTIEEVCAIRADGTKDEHLKIDLTASRTYTEVEDENNIFTPGLYYLHRTARTDSEGIYAISRMSHAEIRSSNRYDVGVVITSDFTVPANYVEVRDYICTTAGAAVDGHNRPAVTPSANINATRKHVEDSDYYNLSYNAWAGTRGGYTGTATATTNSDCLRQYWANDNTTDYNQNQVLVRYNTLGEIVYAISFAHTDSAGENYAQQVWRSVTLDRAKPDAATRYIEISKEAAQVLAEGDTVKLTDAIAKITVGGKEMTKDTANDKFYVTVNRASSYAIEVTMAAGYESCVLTGSDKIANVTLTGSNPYTLTFLEGNTAKDIRLQVPADSIEEAETRTVAEARADAEAELAKPVDTSKLNETGVKMVDDAKKALQAVIDNEDATAKELDDAVATYKTAIEAALKEIKEDDGSETQPVSVTITWKVGALSVADEAKNFTATKAAGADTWTLDLGTLALPEDFPAMGDVSALVLKSVTPADTGITGGTTSILTSTEAFPATLAVTVEFGFDTSDDNDNPSTGDFDTDIEFSRVNTRILADETAPAFTLKVTANREGIKPVQCTLDGNMNGLILVSPDSVAPNWEEGFGEPTVEDGKKVWRIQATASQEDYDALVADPAKLQAIWQAGEDTEGPEPSDPLEQVRADALADVESYKATVVATLTGDDATNAANALNRVKALIGAASATEESIATAVATYKRTIDSLAPVEANEDVTAGDEFVSEKVETVVENGTPVTKETFAAPNGIEIVKKTTQDENGEPATEMAVTVPAALIPKSADIETSDYISDSNNSTSAAVKAELAENFTSAANTEAVEASKFTVRGPEGVKPEIMNNDEDGNTYIVATQGDDVVTQQTQAATTTVVWNVTIYVKVTNTNSTPTIHEFSADLDFSITFPNVDSARADALKLVEAYLTEKNVTAEQVAEEYAAVTAAINAITDPEKLAENQVKTTNEWLTFAAAVDAVKEAADAAEAFAAEKVKAKAAIDKMVTDAHVSVAKVQEAYDNAIQVVEDAATDAALAAIWTKATGEQENGSLVSNHEAILALRIALQNSTDGSIKSVFAAPLADTKGIVENGAALVDAATYKAELVDNKVTVTANKLRLHGRGETNQNPAPEELGYWAGFFVEAPDTMPNSMGFATAVTHVKASWGTVLPEGNATAIDNEDPAGVGYAFYCNVGSKNADYLAARTKATIQWYASETEALGEPITLDVEWNCTPSDAAPFEVTKANLHDNSGTITDDEKICDNYTVKATQTSWNTVDVVISAENLAKHKADVSLGVTEENAQSMWIGFGVVAPTGVTGVQKRIDTVTAQGTLTGTFTNGSYNAHLNTTEDKNNAEGTVTDPKTGFVQYFGLVTGAEQYVVIVQWVGANGAMNETVYNVSFNVNFAPAATETEPEVDPGTPSQGGTGSEGTV